jgi:hypothetical protein
MKVCDKKTITLYEIAVGDAREGAALFCKECHACLVYHDGTWEKEEV